MKRIELLLAGALSAACGGTETGNPGVASLALGLNASDPAVATINEEGTGHRVDELWVSIESIGFVGCGPDSPEVPVNTAGTVVDLAAGTAIEHQRPTGEVCGAVLTISEGLLPDPLGSSEIPASVTVLGERNDGIPFAIVSNASLVVALSGEPFAIHLEEQLLLAFDVSLWLGNAVLDTAMPVDDRILLDGVMHPATTQQFEEQVAATLHRDLNANGAVEEDEEELAGPH